MTTGDRLILWDIDGTLIDGGGVGSEVFDLAIERVTGRRPPHRLDLSGMTDPQIVADYLALLDIEPARAAGLIQPVLLCLEAEMAAAAEAIARRGRVLPGVLEIVHRLNDDSRALQTVLTGNLAPNARVKLGAFGLDSLLDMDVGAYGSDHHDRCELVPVAVNRVATHRQRHFRSEETWVIGDSANDLFCARAGGVRCLLVGTGRTSHEDLARLGPDAALSDLGDVDLVLSFL